MPNIQMCESCTNRWLADLFEAMGETDKANTIRAAGCHWWWTVTTENQDTGIVSTEQTCGRRFVAAHYNRVGSIAVETLQTAQSVRNNTDRHLTRMVNSVGQLARAIATARVLQVVDSDLGTESRLITGTGDSNEHEHEEYAHGYEHEHDPDAGNVGDVGATGDDGERRTQGIDGSDGR